MIPGDIDLTENLDFRKVVKREIPQLPSVWNGNNDVEAGIQYNRINTTFSEIIDETFIYRPSSNSDITIRRFDVGDDVYFDVEETFNTIDTWNTFDSFNSASTSTTSTLYSWNSYLTYRYSTVLDDSAAISSYKTKAHYKTKKKRDVFGNIIPSIDVIPKIPWDSSRGYQYTRRIPWGSAEKETYTPSIAWKEEEKRKNSLNYLYDGWIDLSRSNEETKVKVNRARSLITWLADKTKRFIEDYFETNVEKTLSYLTNMSWIRVRDAVVD